MSNFRISSWTVTAENPNTTHVVATVLTDINGLNKRESYEFDIEGRFDTITPEFEQAVQAKLVEAGVL